MAAAPPAKAAAMASAATVFLACMIELLIAKTGCRLDRGTGRPVPFPRWRFCATVAASSCSLHQAFMKTVTTFLAAALLSAAAHAADKPPVNAGPYVPSPSSVVADMLTLAGVGPKDFVIDLGSGDGRIVLTAAKVFGARGFGVDINEKLVKEANEAAKLQGVADRASFTIQDLFKTNISKATVLTMYLLTNTVNMLKDKLLAELNPGTRVISHDYPLSGWIPERYVQMDLEDKVAISGVTTTLIYLYVVPAKADGA